MKSAKLSRIKKSTRALKPKKSVSRRSSTNQQLKLVKSFQASRALMVVGLLLVGAGIFARFALATDNMTTDVCIPVQVTDISKFVPNSHQVGYSFVSLGQGKTATAVVKSGSRCLNYTVSLVSYQRTSSQPGDKFPVFDSKTVALTGGATTMQVKLPNCGYEVDLAYGLVRRPGNGQSYSSQKQLIWGVQGGSGSCGSTSISPSPASTPSPTQTATPAPSPNPTSTTTPNLTPAPTSTLIPTITPTRTPSPSPTIIPTPSATPTPALSPTPTPGAGGGILTPTPTPSPIPGESPVPTTPNTPIFSFIPQTGNTDLVMIFFGSAFTALGVFLYIRRNRHFKRR